MMRWLATVLLFGLTPAADRTLFDFEAADDAARWSDYPLTELKQKEPGVRIERTDKGATSGQFALKLTFDGGFWPAVSTDQIAVPGDWKEFQTLLADVTTDRRCLIGFRILQEKSSDPETIKKHEGRAWWDRTALLEPGRNEIRVVIHENGYGVRPEYGAVVRFAIYAYKPEPGLSVTVDSIRLSPDWPEPRNIGYFSPYSQDGFSTPKAKAWGASRELPKFRLAGSEVDVRDVIELGKSRKDAWTPPPPSTLEAAESALRELHESLRKEHPTALLKILRDGENGFEGWKDTHISSHGPDGPNDWRTRSHGKLESIEAFMRHRSVLMKVELGSLPAGSRILAARLLLTRTDAKLPSKPNFWIAEPCMRPWVEDEANGYEYAKGRLWKAVNGTYYGEDPDFLPIFLAQGPAGAPVSVWDFTEAVKFWTEGKHENHGFMLHGDSRDYMKVCSREAKDLKKRPALAVIYVP
ncbi:MAG: DNRLRE domain-containing protein [Planctomycetes bacterium]|nr:DNRLRE domain-containing protein [Planctomycetota bacterium]